MINLSVDEAYAFDFLSIAQVKSALREENRNIYRDYLISLLNQIGDEKVRMILDSEEYKGLYRVNKEIFDTIEKIRQGESIDARVVDNANTERYKLKMALQKKFFNEDVNEWKS